MEKTRENRRTKYTKALIKNSLMELMLQRPITKITVKEICDNADVNRSTFYTYYSDQYDLLTQIENDIIAEVNEKLGSYHFNTAQSEAMQMIERILIYVAENGAFCAMLLSEQGDAGFQKNLLGIAKEQLVGEWTASNQIDPETAEYIYLFAVKGSIGLIQNWLKNGLNKKPVEMAEMILRLTSQGIAAYA